MTQLDISRSDLPLDAVITKASTNALKVENELRKRQQLQIVTESMAAAVTRCSSDLRYLWVSKAFADWIGLSAEEIQGPEDRRRPWD